jgi:RNA polymerase sigma-B factor
VNASVTVDPGARRLQEMRLAITAANNTLTHTLGRSPTAATSPRLDVTEEEVLEGLEGGAAYSATSLSASAGAGDLELGRLSAADPEYALMEARIAIGPAMQKLDAREQRIITLRFYGNRTQQEIAKQIGISQMDVPGSTPEPSPPPGRTCSTNSSGSASATA